MQKISLFHLFTLQIQSIFYHVNPKKLGEIVAACKKSGNSICSFLRYKVNLESRDQIGHRHILTMPNQKRFKQLSIFVNLYQHAKNEAVSSTCSGEIVDLKILQSDQLRTFWPISHE